MFLKTQINIKLYYLLNCFAITISKSAVAPPAWADPKLNPCATQPRGWQLLYWPPDGQCYKIYQIGYPCPEGMELTPTAISSNSSLKHIMAECKCPPKTAEYPDDNRCYKLFTNGPCGKGQYFAPDKNIELAKHNRRWGKCKSLDNCQNSNELFWPQDNKCYLYLSQGPCPKGQLLTIGPDDISTCKCNHKREMRKYWSNGNGCYEHFTKGPCKENGHLFLPNQSCGCHSLLPHYYNETRMCYEIGTIGPCNAGEQFLLDYNKKSATCQCKKGHIRYEKDLNCYRPYTQGPCNHGYILINKTTCIEQPCKKGYLYFPINKSCYRIGSRGPCKKNHIVSFDFRTRPSIDGISYNGVCGCSQLGDNHECLERKETICNSNNNMVLFNNQCFKIYSQSPCPSGAWLVIQRQSKASDFLPHEGVCECMPGYKETILNNSEKEEIKCNGPTVALAEFLNRQSRTVSNFQI
ncbi:hypothetical protein RN001_002349 [Aquatica leii]|uniref:DUF4789 domain-containing protein n=1 Tax=Aquatica leii TaxID=1421715 RepID=A0AAN7SR72_9COLE|nr:hypothetical protein RN001_002349 [Aquatica leii]